MEHEGLLYLKPQFTTPTGNLPVVPGPRETSWSHRVVSSSLTRDLRTPGPCVPDYGKGDASNKSKGRDGSVSTPDSFTPLLPGSDLSLLGGNENGTLGLEFRVRPCVVPSALRLTRLLETSVYCCTGGPSTPWSGSE